MPHTLHITRRVQQSNNLEGNMHKETMPQQVVSDERSQIQTTAVAQLYDEKEREKTVKRKDRSKLQTTTAHTAPRNDPNRAKGAVEEYTKGGVRQKRERGAAGFIRKNTCQRETPETLSR